MITGAKVAVEVNETAPVNTATVNDEIKRNHLQTAPIKPLVSDYQGTNFTVKFSRLKKALRKRSSSIF